MHKYYCYYRAMGRKQFLTVRKEEAMSVMLYKKKRHAS